MADGRKHEAANSINGSRCSQTSAYLAGYGSLSTSACMYDGCTIACFAGLVIGKEKKKKLGHTSRSRRFNIPDGSFIVLI